MAWKRFGATPNAFPLPNPDRSSIQFVHLIDFHLIDFHPIDLHPIDLHPIDLEESYQRVS